jgi:fluoride exporter
MNALTQSGLVALGAAVGANLRYWIGYAVRANMQAWPWPTLLINVLGSIVLGAFAVTALEKGWGEGWRLLVAVGICGGFTTFSTFSFEAVDLLLRKNYATAAQYMIASVVLCIAGCWLGGHFARLTLSK